MEEISKVTLHYISGRQIEMDKQQAIDILVGKTIEAANRTDALENKVRIREPIELTPKTISEFQANATSVELVDYYIRYENGTVMKTMAIDDFKRLYPDMHSDVIKK